VETNEGFVYEEIAGARFALWRRPRDPIGSRLFAPLEFAFYLAGWAAFELCKWNLLYFTVFGPLTPGVALALGIALVIALFGGILVWALRRAGRLQRKRYAEWEALHPGESGVPCRLMAAGYLCGPLESGMLSVEWPWLVFRGLRCEFRFAARDEVPAKRRHALRFAYASPAGPRTSTIMLGGYGPAGRVRPSRASAQLGGPLDEWRKADPSDLSVYPPMRVLRFSFEPGFLTFIAPAMLAALLAVPILSDLYGVLLFWTIRPVPLDEYAIATGMVLGGYTLALAVGGVILRLIDRRNRRIDALAASAKVSRRTTDTSVDG
jgi:hypothetical protein